MDAETKKPSDLKLALLYGLENTYNLLTHHDRYYGRDTESNRTKAELFEEQIRVINKSLSLFDRENTVEFTSYEYSCGDGCCYEQGYDVVFNGENLGGFPDTSYGLQAVIEELGIDLTLTYA